MKFWSALVAILFLNVSGTYGGILARFHMSPKLGGTIDVELYDLDKPITVSNFVAYVKAGLWHDTVMNSWLRDNFLQGGYYNLPHDPTLLTSWTNQPQLVPTFPPIPSELNVGRFFSNEFATLGMGHDPANVNSATAGWYFNLANYPQRDTEDGGYTVFGRVLRGTNVLRRFTSAVNETNIVHVSGTRVPVYTEDNENAYVLNVDIELLTAEIRIVPEGAEISWNSVFRLPNIVEQTSVLPPVWQPVATVIGAGGRMSITNNPGNATLRHYRVRIDYDQQTP